MNPLISVIIPNYNHAKYLAERIDSVLNQSYKNIEIIILDDASTDGSVNIIKQYQNHPLVKQVIVNNVNHGSTFMQWQLGIAKAKGEFIWIAESDDYSELNFLEDLVGNLSTENVIAYSQSYFLHENGELNFHPNAKYLFHHFEGSEFIKEFMLNGNAIYNASACIWKKSCFDKVTQEFIKYTYCGDWIFWIEIMTQGTVLACGKFHNYYRRHSNTVSSRSKKTNLIYREELLAVSYLSKLVPQFTLNSRAIIKKKIKMLFYDDDFKKAYKEVIKTNLEIQQTFGLTTITLLRLKGQLKRLVGRR